MLRSRKQDPFSAPHLQRNGTCFECFTKPSPLGKAETLKWHGVRYQQLGNLSKPSPRANKEWKSFKEGHRNHKFVWSQLSEVRGAAGTQHLITLLSSWAAALCGGGAIIHGSQAGVTGNAGVNLQTPISELLQLCMAGRNSARPSHLKLGVQSWLGLKQTCYRFCLISSIWYQRHGWTINKPFPSSPSHCY